MNDTTANGQVLVTRLSNGEPVDLSTLSVEGLYRLHYEEESFVAKEALGLPPFSGERNDLVYKGYQFVTEVMDYRYFKETGDTQKIFGAGHGSSKALNKLIRKKVKENKPGQTVLCELGVGTGFAIRNVLENAGPSELKIKGCDINLTSTAQELTNEFSNVDLVEMNAYDFIKTLPDRSVDILYADNVFEHFFPDEAETICDEIVKKLKPHAILFLIIPNKNIGPGDISGRYLPMGEKASGFHFMEMSFNEVTRCFSKYGMRNLYCVFYIPKVQKFVLVRSSVITKIKLKLESVLAKIPVKFIKYVMLYCGGYHISIFKLR
jgi:SAM-dependent methyltransferase